MKIICLDKDAKTQIIEVGEGPWRGALEHCGKGKRKENQKAQDIVTEGYVEESDAITAFTVLHKHSGLHQILATPSQVINYIIQQ